ncbi:hypothetical protein [Treponema sp.]|uniref:hypothetical protein n=1 Tax=Treponema sp. TaxID=166 RepID=UPI00298E19CD|nr:hypothetical protein [Treponema sp.]
MKKCFLKATGLLTIASALLLASCSDGSSDYDGRVDTVINLKAPSVTAKAYPGVNLVSWDVVPGAEKYEVYRYETGKATDKDIVQVGVNVCYVDTDVQNNVSYTYEVMARGNVSTRKVVTFDSATGKATVTGILPPASTSALNLAAYEDGYDGKKPKTIDDSKKISADNIEIYNDNAQLRVAFNAKAYLTYAVTSVEGNEYDVTQVESWSANKDTIVNDSVLPVTADNLASAGTQTVWVKAVSKNGYFATVDYIKAGTVTYERLGDGVEDTDITSAGYTDTAKKNIRVVFTPGSLDNGAKAGTELYKVYRKSFGTDYVAVAAPVKALSDDSYVVDDPIEDSTKKYTYAVVLTDGTKFGAKYGTKEVDAATLAKTTITIDPAGTPSTLDADKLENDIKWTVTLDNVNQTFEARVLTVKKGDTLENTTPKASDFTEKLEGWKVEGDTTAMKYYNYSANVPVGKTYLCVKVSEEGKESIYKISRAVTVDDATVSAPELSLAAYDDSRTNATPSSQRVIENDIIINVSDDIDIASDSVENYTYELYRTYSSVKTDMTNGTITFVADTENWVNVGTVAMKSNGVYDPTQTTVTYKGVVKQDNVEDSVYAYKVVKTNNANKVSNSTAVSYIKIDTAETVTIYETKPLVTASFATSGVASSNVEVTFKKDTQNLTAVYGSAGDLLDGLVVGYTDAETSDDINYTLYRATLSDSLTELVYEKLSISAAPSPKTVSRSINKLVNGSVETENVAYVDYIDYTFTDPNVSTNASYSYIVVASKEKAQNVIFTPASLTGAN